MPKRISTKEVMHVANLARLRVSEAEAERYSGQLSQVLEHMADIEALEFKVSSGDEVYVDETLLRSDEVVRYGRQEEIFKSAPLVENSMFKVPPILGEG